MKKYLLLGTSLIVASSAYAVTCEQLPECSSLGFTQTATDCAGKNMLKCPFETDKVFCGGDTGQGCDAVGDILYSDLNCYDESSLPSGKVTPIAVVFDTENRLAIGLNNAPKVMQWASVEEDISGLTNYFSSTTALEETTTGKENTATIVALGGDYASSDYAPGYCYNLTEGGQPIGSWFLPNFKELKAIKDNQTTIDTALTNAGGTALANWSYWSSTEHESFDAWEPSMANSLMHYSDKTNYTSVRCGLAF